MAGHRVRRLAVLDPLLGTAVIQWGACVTHAMPGLVVVEHEFSVPLDHAAPGGGADHRLCPGGRDPDGRDRPFLVFLQGGPGRSAAPDAATRRARAGSARALKDFRVLLLDQRGTGRSTPVGALPGASPPSRPLPHALPRRRIVRDPSYRAELGGEPWSMLGQSFGGMCA